MYWDVVEVKPEPDYRLFVRFQDGLVGREALRQFTIRWPERVEQARAA